MKKLILLLFLGLFVLTSVVISNIHLQTSDNQEIEYVAPTNHNLAFDHVSFDANKQNLLLCYGLKPLNDINKTMQQGISNSFTDADISLFAQQNFNILGNNLIDIEDNLKYLPYGYYDYSESCDLKNTGKLNVNNIFLEDNLKYLTLHRFYDYQRYVDKYRPVSNYKISSLS